MYSKVKNKIKDKIFLNYVKNSSWMLFEQIIRLFSGVFVSIYVARYLGPENFGVLSFSLAISTFLMAFTRLGMDSILLREVVNTNSRVDIKKLLSTSFWLMFITSFFIYSILFIILNLVDEEKSVKFVISIICFSSIFVPFLSLDYFYQSQIKSKFSSVCKVIAISIISVIKLYLVYIEASLLSFAFSVLFDYFLVAILLFFSMYFTKLIKPFELFKHFEFNIAKTLLKSSFYMVISALAVIVNMRIDQIMIKTMLGFEQAGIYSAAAKFYESWSIFPHVLTISLLPIIMKIKNDSHHNYENKLCLLIRSLFYVSFIVSLIVTFFSQELVDITFGSAYAESASLIGIIMWSSVFISIGSVTSRYLTIEKMEKKILFRTIVTTVLNVVLNYIFIPIYGIKSAAWTTLFCALISSYVLDWFDDELKSLRRIKTKALFFI
jgi:O-antigen/teichoic acid export membrane protein